ncbi:DUF4355 domain-containing protein [Pseudogracilibacillus sp. SO30301A]|uniref:DUF4355 domain-containing protein n=1 Tax=Pseudogracilibacillus sp. SO30301A TaxID=3098291 RepID=UPI00300E6323
MTNDENKKIAEETPYTVADIASSFMSRAERGLPLNLQFFAEQDDDPGDNPADDPQDDDPKDDDLSNDDPKDDDKPKFTQKQLDKIVQDRVNRLEKDKQDAIDEAKKLAKMNADEKRQYELEKLQRENEELKAAQNRFELGKEATKMLSASGITATDEILDFVVREDAEKTNEAVKAFSALVDKISDERMKEKLKGKPPKTQTQQNGFKNPFSKEHRNLTEQARIFCLFLAIYIQTNFH